MYTGDYEQVGELYRQAQERARREIIWQQEIAKVTEMMLREWDTLEQHVGRCSLCESPEVLRVNIRHNEELEPGAGSEEAAQWIERMPAVFISPMFKKEAVLRGAEEIWFGYGVPMETFERLEMAHMPEEKHIERCLCVTTVIYSRGEGHISCKTLAPMLDYCRENNLEICGDGWGITLGDCDRNDETFRFHRVYMPVIQKET